MKYCVAAVMLDQQSRETNRAFKVPICIMLMIAGFVPHRSMIQETPACVTTAKGSWSVSVAALVDPVQPGGGVKLGQALVQGTLSCLEMCVFLYNYALIIDIHVLIEN